MTALVIPTVNINGTPAADLIEQLSAVCHALDHAREAIGLATPHGRDFQMNGQGLAEQAREAFRERQRVLARMSADFMDLALAIQSQGRSLPK